MSDKSIHLNPDHYLQTDAGRVFTAERNALAWEHLYADLNAALQAYPRPIVMVIGVQGAGKSTWIKQRMSVAHDTIYVDSTFATVQRRSGVVEMAKVAGVRVSVIWVRVGLKTALRRNKRRPTDEVVPDNAVENVYRIFEPPSLAEGFYEVVTIGDDGDEVQAAPSAMTITFESPDQADVIALIADLDAYQDTLYPPENRHALDLASLKRDNVVFAVARDGEGQAVGCGAIVLYPEFGELKRLYVSPQGRGQGIARSLIAHLEARAMELGCQLFTLETGPYQHEALALYASAGYERCGSFGDYADDPLSVFMQKCPRI